MYGQLTSIIVSVILFIFVLIAFVAQTVSIRTDHYDLFTADSPGTTMIVIEVIAVFYSFGFVLWQTQIGPTFVSNTEDHYKLIVAICLVLALIWVFAFISCLVAYTYNAFLLFLIVANTIQTLLVPYVMFRLKREQFPITQNQTGNQSQEQANLLEELRIIRQKLEQHENQQFVKTGQSTTFSNQPSFDFDYNNPLRIPKVSFADQPNIY